MHGAVVLIKVGNKRSNLGVPRICKFFISVYYFFIVSILFLREVIIREIMDIGLLSCEALSHCGRRNTTYTALRFIKLVLLILSPSSSIKRLDSLRKHAQTFKPRFLSMESITNSLKIHDTQ